MNNIFKNKIGVCLIALLCCFLWGSAFPSIKIGYKLFEISGAASTMLFAGVRFALAGVFVIIFGSIINKKFLVPKRSSLKYVGALSLAQTALHYTFFYIGLSNCSGVKSSVINATSVFFSIIVACFIFKHEKFTVYKIIGCILGFSGILAINFDGLNFSFSLLGEGFILCSAISSAFSSSMIKRFTKKENAVTLSGYQFLLGGIILIAVGAVMGGRMGDISLEGALILIYLALISSVAYTLWGLLLKYNNPSTIATFGFLNPVFGVLLSYIFLNESADLLLCLVALAFISAGIVVINVLGEKNKKAIDLNG